MKAQSGAVSASLVCIFRVGVSGQGEATRTFSERGQPPVARVASHLSGGCWSGP